MLSAVLPESGNPLQCTAPLEILLKPRSSRTEVGTSAPQFRQTTYSVGPLDPELYRPEILETINTAIDERGAELQELSLYIHAHPELGFEEKLAHDKLTKFVESEGFSVTRHYLDLDTAWRATFSHRNGERVIGVCSEMDALPGIGHACGHNLIAIAGVAVAIAIKAALLRHDIPGTIVLLGTPAEENGGGKIILLERGAFREMDACIMCHPISGPSNSAGIGTLSARQVIEVEYFGKTAHAAGYPWQGQNTLDAAFLAYAGLSALRQQLEPGAMSHGTIIGKDWTPNIIPDYAKLIWMIRGRTSQQLAALREKVRHCFEGAAIQAGCRVEIREGQLWNELRHNRALASDFTNNMSRRFGINIMTVDESSNGASSDFGNVSYELPSIHPVYTIPGEPGGANHTSAFAEAAKTESAHTLTFICAKSLAMTGLRVLGDSAFFAAVKKTFQEEQADFTTPP